MIWYILLSSLIVIVIAAVADNGSVNSALCWIAGFIVGGVFVAGLVLQWGVLR